MGVNVAQVPDADPFGGADDPFGGGGMAPVQRTCHARCWHNGAPRTRARRAAGLEGLCGDAPSLLFFRDSMPGCPRLRPLDTHSGKNFFCYFFERGKQAAAAHGSMDDMFGGGGVSTAPADDIFGGTMQGNLMNSPPPPAPPVANGHTHTHTHTHKHTHAHTYMHT